MRWTILWVVLIGMVLVPFLLFEQQFNAFAETVTRSDTSRWLVAGAIFSLLALDVFLPVPSSIVSTASGVLLGFSIGTAVVWSGMMTGCLIGYAVGSRGSGAARRLVGEEGIGRAAALVQRYGDLTIVLCRPVPVLAEASVVFAGLVRGALRPIRPAHRGVQPWHRRRLRRGRRLLTPPRFVLVPHRVRGRARAAGGLHSALTNDLRARSR